MKRLDRLYKEQKIVSERQKYNIRICNTYNWLVGEWNRLEAAIEEEVELEERLAAIERQLEAK